MTTPNRQATHMTDQSSAYSQGNEATDRLDNQVNNVTSIAFGSPDEDYALSDAEHNDMAMLVGTGTISANKNLWVRPRNTRFAVYNNTSGGFDIVVGVEDTGGGSPSIPLGTTVSVPTGAVLLLHCDGTNVYQSSMWNFRDLTETVDAVDADNDLFVIWDASVGEFRSVNANIFPGGASTAVGYDFGFFFQGTPDASQIVFRMMTTRAFSIEAGATDSQAWFETAPTGAMTFTMYRDDKGSPRENVGTFQFSAGVNTGTFTVASQITFAAGMIFEIEAPASVDSTASDLSVSFKGERS